MSTSKFQKDHIDGNQNPNKKINHVADFNNVHYRTAEHIGPGNEIIPGTKPGQRMYVALETLSYTQNGAYDTDREGQAHFAVQGRRGDDGIVRPHHLIGRAEKTRSRWAI